MAWMRGFSQLWPQHAIVRCARMQSPGLRVGESASVLVPTIGEWMSGMDEFLSGRTSNCGCTFW